VIAHTGDSHVLLPPFLERLASSGRSVDFALVDGDHSADGVRRDLEDLIASPAVERAVIVAHDTANEEVRAGLEAPGILDHPQVAYADLDFVAGHLSAEGPYAGQLWGGLGLIVMDSAAPGGRAPGGGGDGLHATGELLRLARDVLAGAP
jgi:hypothetical protein